MKSSTEIKPHFVPLQKDHHLLANKNPTAMIMYSSAMVQFLMNVIKKKKPTLCDASVQCDLNQNYIEAFSKRPPRENLRRVTPKAKARSHYPPQQVIPLNLSVKNLSQNYLTVTDKQPGAVPLQCVPPQRHTLLTQANSKHVHDRHFKPTPAFWHPWANYSLSSVMKTRTTLKNNTSFSMPNIQPGINNYNRAKYF